jgi:hypothetical protein
MTTDPSVTTYRLDHTTAHAARELLGEALPSMLETARDLSIDEFSPAAFDGLEAAFAILHEIGWAPRDGDQEATVGIGSPGARNLLRRCAYSAMLHGDEDLFEHGERLILALGWRLERVGVADEEIEAGGEG